MPTQRRIVTDPSGTGPIAADLQSVEQIAGRRGYAHASGGGFVGGLLVGWIVGLLIGTP